MKKKPFVRKFGSVTPRSYGGVEEWSAEDYYCNAHLSIKYHDLDKKGFAVTDTNKTAVLKCYRRFFSDGKFMGKMELGFIDNMEAVMARMAEKKPVNITSILAHYANLQVAVNGKTIKLYKAGVPFAQNFCDSSTVYKMVQKDLQQYIVDGEICFTVIYSTGQAIELPTRAEKINEYDVKGEVIRLYGYRMHHEGYSFKVWIIELPCAEKDLSVKLKGILRNLRINLLRIHAEKETVRILLNSINDETITLQPGSAKTELADNYLKEIAEKLFSKKRYKLEQEGMLDFALQSENVAMPGSFSTLENSIHRFSDQYTSKNIEQAVETNVGRQPKGHFISYFESHR